MSAMQMPTESSVRCRAAQESLARAAGQCVEALRREAPGVRAGQVDAIHDMRVASRRLRSLLREFRPWAQGPTAEALMEAARAITRLLGPARELDVLAGDLARWSEEYNAPWALAAAHARESLLAERAALNARCAEAAAHAASELFAQLRGSALCRGATAACLRDYMPKRLRKRFDATCEAYRRWRKTGRDEDLHRLRIAFKKLRYACEHFSPHYSRRMARFIRELKALQEILGDWNDRRILRDTLGRLEASAPYRAGQGYPELIADAGAEARVLLREFEERAEKFFDKENRDSVARLFLRPRLDCCAPGRAEGAHD